MGLPQDRAVRPRDPELDVEVRVVHPEMERSGALRQDQERPDLPRGHALLCGRAEREHGLGLRGD
jgi:hypothetical protein